MSSWGDTKRHRDTGLLTRDDTLGIVARMISDFKSIIEAWPPHPDADVSDPLASLKAFASDVGVTLNNVKQMRRRNAIHGSHWLAVVEAARARGIDGITLRLLAELGARKAQDCSGVNHIQTSRVGQSVSVAA